MKEADYAPPAPPIAISPHQNATGTCAIGFPPGWFGDFHPAPKHQWMMIMSGTLEIGFSDGEKRILLSSSTALGQGPIICSYVNLKLRREAEIGRRAQLKEEL
ncbi:MAG: hypothetical protein ABF290_07950 [Thiogranum sp.]